MDVPDLDIMWSHTYTSDDIIEVPGFTVSLPSIFSAGVYVQVGLTNNGDRLRLNKVSTLCKAQYGIVLCIGCLARTSGIATNNNDLLWTVTNKGTRLNF